MHYYKKSFKQVEMTKMILKMTLKYTKQNVSYSILNYPSKPVNRKNCDSHVNRKYQTLFARRRNQTNVKCSKHLKFQSFKV